MLNAFQKQLDHLAIDRDKSFEKHVKSRWQGEAPVGLVGELKDFVRLLPTIEKRIYSLYVQLPADSKVKGIDRQFLTYMYQPDDFLPKDEKNGLFGYLDDAYIAALFFELMVEEIEALDVGWVRKADLDLLKRLIKLRRKARLVIPDEAIKIKDMLGDLFAGDDTAYKKLFRGKIPA